MADENSCVVMCCSLLQLVAACCSVLQRVAVCCRARGGAAGLHMAVVDYVAVCCNVLQLVAVCSGSSCSYVCSHTHGG